MKKIKYYNEIFYIFLFLICIFYTIFYVKLSASDNTDIMLHTNRISRNLFVKDFDWSKIGYNVGILTYPMYHIIQNIPVKLLGIRYELAAAIVLSFLGMLSILVMRKLIYYVACWGGSGTIHSVFQKYLVDIMAISSIFFGNISGRLTEGRFYSLQGNPNPVHNPTLLMVRPIGILCFMLMMNFFIGVIKKEPVLWKKQGAYAAVLGMSCLAKPSFAFVALPAWAVFTMFIMIKNKSMKMGMQILLPTLPAVVILCVQFAFNFTATASESHREILVKFGSYAGFTIKQVILVTISMCAIPMICSVAAIYLKDKNMILLNSTLILLVSWLEMFLLSDGNHGNFSWGWDLAVQLATMVGLTWFLFHRKIPIIFKMATATIFLYQLCSGITYYIMVYNQNDYWF